MATKLMLVLGLFAAIARVGSADAQGLREIALVIGNSGYQAVPALKTPFNDAKTYLRPIDISRIHTCR